MSVPNNLGTNLHFLCLVPAPEAGAQEGAGVIGQGEKSEESGSAKQETGMRVVELDGTHADRGECKSFLKVCMILSFILGVRNLTRIHAHPN